MSSTTDPQTDKKEPRKRCYVPRKKKAKPGEPYRNQAMIDQGIYTQNGSVIHIRPRRNNETFRTYRRRLGHMTPEEREERDKRREPRRKARWNRYMRRYRKKHKKPKQRKLKPYVNEHNEPYRTLRPKRKCRPDVKPRARRPKYVYKRKKKPAEKKKPQYKYYIAQFKNGRFQRYLGKYVGITEARRELEKVKREMKQPVIPETIYHSDWWVEDSCNECVLLEKGGSGETMLQNEYGKYTLNLTNKEGWTVVDKFAFDVEETFWVWGYQKRYDRKDCMWIYENIVLPKTVSKYDFIRIYTYRNKVLFKDDYGNIQLVICKADSVSVLLYNKLQELVKKDRIKNVMFVGDFSDQNKADDPVVNEIREITGWPTKQIYMFSTTYSLSKKRVQDKINHKNSKSGKDVEEILRKYDAESESVATTD